MLVKKNKTKEHNNKTNQANKNEQPTNQTKQKSHSDMDSKFPVLGHSRLF